MRSTAYWLLPRIELVQHDRGDVLIVAGRSGPSGQVGAGVGAFMQGRTDRLGELGFDQRLVDRLGRLTDPVTDVGDLEYLQDFEQAD